MNVFDSFDDKALILELLEGMYAELGKCVRSGTWGKKKQVILTVASGSFLENDTPAEEQENIWLTYEEIIEEKKSKAKKIKWFYFGAAVF